MENDIFYWNEINKTLIWKTLKKQLILILAAAVTLFFSVLTYQMLTDQPRYRSKATAAVVADASNINYSGLSNAVKYAETYVSGLAGNSMLSMAKETAGIHAQDIVLSASQIKDTNLIELSVTASDQYSAYAVLDAVVNQYSTVTDGMNLNGTIYFVQNASLPAAVSGDISLRTAFLVCAAGAVVMTACFVLAAVLRPTIKTKTAANRKIGEICFGTLPMVKASQKQLIPDSQTLPEFTDRIFLAANRIDRKMRSEGKKVLMITSAEEKEGTTTVALGLSCALAQKGRKTALLDCNWKNPSLSRFFGREDQMSIEDVLKENCPIQDVLRKEEPYGIYVAGSDGSCVTVPFYAAHLKAFISDCAEKMDYIVLDAGSMKDSVNAEILAYITDVSVLTAAEDSAKTERIKEAVWKLKESSSNFAGYVFNKQDGGWKHE